MKMGILVISPLLTGVVLVAGESQRMTKINWDGSFELKSMLADNETDLDKAKRDTRSETLTRVRLGVDVDFSDDLSGRLELLRSPNSAGSSAQYGGGDRPTTASSEQDSITIQNAFVSLGGFLGLDSLVVGRQYVGDTNDLIAYYGPNNDDLLTVNALDSVSAFKRWGPFHFTIVSGKERDDDPPGDTDNGDATDAGDIDVSWGTIEWDAADPGLPYKVPLQAGFYVKNSAGSDSEDDNDRLQVYDVRLGFLNPDESSYVRVEVAANGGHLNRPSGDGGQLTYKGSAFLMSAGTRLPAWRVGVRGKMFSSPGNDDSTDTLDYSFHPIRSDLRFGEILSNDNTFQIHNSTFAGTSAAFTGGPYHSPPLGDGLTMINLGVDWVIPSTNDKLSATVDFYSLKVAETSVSAGDRIGNEFDFRLHYKHSDRVFAEAGYAQLVPGNYLTYNVRPNDDVRKIWAALNIRVGRSH